MPMVAFFTDVNLNSKRHIIMNIISRSIKYLKIESAWQKQYDPMAPKKGDAAPDFDLIDAEGQGRVGLSDFQGKKPVALVFGSFT